MDRPAQMNILLRAVVAVVILSVALVGAFSFGYLGGSSCSGGDLGAPAPSKDDIQVIQSIEQNSTFRNLENGKPYQYSSLALGQPRYDNGTLGPQTTIFGFTCGPQTCNPPIEAIVNSQNNVVSISLNENHTLGNFNGSSPAQSTSC
jgi:hypothetical protein